MACTSSVPVTTPLPLMYLVWFCRTMLIQVISFYLAILNYVYFLVSDTSLVYVHHTEPSPDFSQPIVSPEPIVCVHGVFGYGDDKSRYLPKYWPHVTTVFPNAIIPTNLSLLCCRDRAIDLFYYLKGGRTDFGASHATEHQHGRYGPVHTGAYPQWGPTNPLVFHGHSLGGPTISWLCHLLYTNGIPGYDVAPNGHHWVKGIISSTAVYRGAPYTIRMGIPRAMTELDTEYMPHQMLYYIAVAITLSSKYLPTCLQYDFGLGINDHDMWNVRGLSFWQVWSSRSNRLLRPRCTAAQDLCVQYADTVNDQMCSMWHDPTWRVFLCNVVSSYDIPLDTEGLHRVPDVHCHVASLLTFLLGAGRFRGHGRERPTMFRGAPWVPTDWLTTDGVVPVCGQLLPTTSVVYPDALPSVILLNEPHYDRTTETISGLQPRTIYRFDHKFDHACITGSFNPNINKTKYHQLIARFVAGLN